MAQQTETTDGGSDEIETYELTVDADTVIRGLKINSKPGEDRRIVFRPNVGSGYGDGALRDVRGVHWDGEAPPQLRPRAFVPDDEPSDVDALVAEARSEAKREGEDPDEWQEVALEVWESDMRRFLKEEITVESEFPEETTTVYRIDYESDE